MTEPDYHAAILELRDIWFSTIMPHHKGAMHTRCNRCLVLAGNVVMGLLELDDEALANYQNHRLKRPYEGPHAYLKKRVKQRTLRKIRPPSA